MKVNINNTKYRVEKTDETEFDLYYYKGILLDEKEPNTNVTGYFVYEDATKVGVLKERLNLKLVLVILTVLASLLAIILFTAVLKTLPEKEFDESSIIKRPSDVSGSVGDDFAQVSQVVGTKEETGTKEDIVLNYKRYVTYENGSVDITYVNIDESATIKIISDKFSSDKIEVAMNETVNKIPITIEDKDFPKNASLLVTIGKETYKCPIVIQLPTEIDVVGASSKNKDDDYFNPSTFKDMEDIIDD